MAPADVERAVERTGARYVADLRAMLAELHKVYEGRAAAQDATIAAHQETIAELRRRAEVAEAERDELRAQPAEGAMPRVAPTGERETTEAPRARDTPPAAHRPAQGRWQRLRRRLGEE